MAKFRKPLIFALCLLPIAIVSGIFVSFYQLDILDDEMIAEVVAQVGSTDVLAVVGAVQTAGYALFCGFFGYILSEKLGLWKPLRVEKKKLLHTLIISVIGGVMLSLDHWVFGSMIDGIREVNAASLTVSGIVSAVLYGGIIEEVLLRLFFMSLIAWIIWKVFFRKYSSENIPSGVFIVSNIVSAMAFAVGHLPSTIAIFGGLTPLLLFRCFLFNGGFGLLFGWLYRKYGIIYSVCSHAVFHIISRLIWVLFV